MHAQDETDIKFLELHLIESVSEGFPSYSCILELLCLCCVEILKNLPVHSFNALIIPILRDCFPNYFLVQTECRYHPKPYLRVTRAVGD